MLHQADEVVLAHIDERRRCLLAEATTARLARRLQPPVLDRLLGALGLRLVQWGVRLHARSEARALNTWDYRTT